MAPPIFECYWQGRLIPGAKLDTLPFLETLRTNRTASGKVRCEGSRRGCHAGILPWAT